MTVFWLKTFLCSRWSLFLVACDVAECKGAFDSSGDLRYGFENKNLLTRIRQARLYCNRVAATLRMVQVL